MSIIAGHYKKGQEGNGVKGGISKRRLLITFYFLHRMKPKLCYKIKIYCTVYAFAGIGSGARAQEVVVVTRENQYHQQVAQDSLKRMVELKTVSGSLVYDLRYATKNNFTHKKLYSSGKTTFLRMPAAMALKKAQETFTTMGWRLKIFDAYRPYYATKKMWELIHDERYVANPAKGSGHNRGLSVDLTLTDLKTGKELDLGTGFDNFSDSAGHSFSHPDSMVMYRRKMLKETMERAGFKALETEWWHYSWPNDRNYELLDLDFKKFRKKGG